MCAVFSVVVFNDSCVERDGLIGEKTEGGMLLVERVKAACSVINGCERTESEKTSTFIYLVFSHEARTRHSNLKGDFFQLTPSPSLLVHN